MSKNLLVGQEVSEVGHVKKIFYKKDGWSTGIMSFNGIEMGFSGNIDAVNEEKVEFIATVVEHPKYGIQLDIASAHAVPETSKTGLIRYLSSGSFHGIGRVTAEKIVDKFGGDTLQIIQEQPNRLLEIEGLSEKKINKIVASAKKNQQVFEIQKNTKGALTINQCIKLIDTYNEKAVETVLKNPYQLIYDIDGIGFNKADTIAYSLGIKEDDENRVREGISYTLKKLADNTGSSYSTTESTINESLRTLFLSKLNDRKQNAVMKSYATTLQRKRAYMSAKFTDEDYAIVEKFENNRSHYEQLIKNQLEIAVAKDIIVRENDVNESRLYFKKNFEYECKCATILYELTVAKPIKNFSDYEITQGIQKYEKYKSKQTQTIFQLNEEQKQAVKMALNNRLSVITGGAGCGKTTILECIISIWNDDKNLCLSAPTGKASQKMSETTGCKATTIHSRYHSKEEHELELVIIDETSMVDLPLASLTLGMFDTCQVVFVGDANQLPSVGVGNILKDMVDSEYIATTKLTQSIRNQGCINHNAEMVNYGNSSKTFEYDSTFDFKEIDNKDLLKEVIKTYKQLHRRYKTKDILILCCQRVRGSACVQTCNQEIQNLVNKDGEVIKSFSNYELRLGDRVMNTVNNRKKIGTDGDGKEIHGVFNGDCGTFAKTDDGYVFVTDDHRTFIYAQDELEDFELAYAMTIHKAQGSEYHAVIMPFNMESYLMLQRNILYTGITRAKKELYIRGQEKAINIAINNDKVKERNSRLKERIEAYATKNN